MGRFIYTIIFIAWVNLPQAVQGDSGQLQVSVDSFAKIVRNPFNKTPLLSTTKSNEIKHLPELSPFQRPAEN